jgi:hypothetical protein
MSESRFPKLLKVKENRKTGWSYWKRGSRLEAGYRTHDGIATILILLPWQSC